MKKRTRQLIGLALATLAAASCGSPRGSVYGLEAGEDLALNVKRAEVSSDPVWVHLVHGGEHCLVLGDDLQGTINGMPLEVVVRGGEVEASEGVFSTSCLPISLRGPATTPGEDLSIRVWDDTLVIEAQFPDLSSSPVSATRCTGASHCTMHRTATTGR